MFGVWPLRILSTSIHFTGELPDSSQPFYRKVIAPFHETDHLGKAIETQPLHRPQWMLLKERHHLLQLLQTTDAQLFSITMVRGDLTAPEKPTESLQDGNIPFVLHHAELGKDLPADSHAGLPIDADEEATLSVNKTDDPVGAQAFLLVVCTGRIVTHLSSTAGYTRVSSI